MHHTIVHVSKLVKNEIIQLYFKNSSYGMVHLKSSMPEYLTGADKLFLLVV